MKLQKFTSIALLSAMVLGVSAPIAFAADDATELSGKGTIQYKENDESDNKETDKVIDPENPDTLVTIDPETEGGNNNDKKGSLRVDFVSHLKFGLQNITTSAGEYYASPTNGDAEDGEKVQRGNFIGVTDQRGDGKPKGWTLSAKVTSPFKNTDQVELKGAQISYSLPHIGSTQDQANFPTATPLVTLNTAGKDADGKDVASTVMASAAAGQGWGAYAIEYGRPSLDENNKVVEDGTGVTPATMDKAVKLSVPANTPLDTTTEYQATITWTIAELPQD